ncbi:uncharacterized protein LOC121202705 [Betta splendens]|uniref:Uncharacterized protein LOC121202705 n=1 Tax=Betta splendens TaxID=158456 RepID=A0A9W2Y7B9_BETSP|nr:uncharacterized protein LOC121202705 [Betta splendens]
MHSQAQAHQHPLMPHHAFTPILHQTSTLLPAPHVMGAHDSNFNVHLKRAASRSSFSPVTAFQPATQTSFSSQKGRWAALHVRIAWNIYYNRKLKSIPQKPNGVYGLLTPEAPSGTGLDSELWQVSDQPSSTHPHPELPCRESGVRTELRKTVHRVSRRHPSDHASSSALCHNLPAHQREEVTPHRQEKPDGKDKHAVDQADTVEGSPLRDRAWDHNVIRQGGSLNRKRQLQHDAFIEAKRLKKEPLDDTLDSSKTFYTDPSWFSMSQMHPAVATPGHHRNTGHLSVFYPNSSTALGGTDVIPYQAAPRELLWNRREHLYSRQSVLKEHSVRPAEAFTGFFMPPLYFLPALGVQEASYLSGREFLHAPENYHPHPYRSQLSHPGFLTTSC